MNKVTLIGHLAKDPVAKITKNGNEQSTFSIGVNDFRNFEETYFFNCVAWNATAKYINNNLVKGQLVAVDGRLINRSYLNAENKKVFITEIIADSIKTYGTIKKSQQNDQTMATNSYELMDSKPEMNSESIYSNNDQVYNVEDILNNESTDDLDDEELISWGE